MFSKLCRWFTKERGPDTTIVPKAHTRSKKRSPIESPESKNEVQKRGPKTVQKVQRGPRRRLKEVQNSPKKVQKGRKTSKKTDLPKGFKTGL